MRGNALAAPGRRDDAQERSGTLREIGKADGMEARANDHANDHANDQESTRERTLGGLALQGWRWLPFLDTVVVVAALLATLALTRSLYLPASNDPKLFVTYASQFWQGPQRFHAFPREYPPLTVLIFALSIFPTHSTLAAAVAQWETWMALLFLVGWGLFYRISGRAAAWRYAILVLALQNLALTRYDLVPGLLCVCALWAGQRRSWRLAYLLLALGALLKIYPAFLVPIVLIEQWRWSGGRLRPVLTGMGLWLATVAAGLLLPLVLSPTALDSMLGYQSGRPIQVESTAATVVWLGSLVGIPVRMTFAYGSWDLVGPLSAALSPITTVLLGLGLLVVYAQVWRRSLPLVQAFLFCLGVVLLTNKVFSAQYMLWIAPIAAEAGTDFALWLLAALLTLADYPFLSAIQNTLYVSSTRWIVMLILAARNGLIAWGTLRALRHLPSSPAASAPVERALGKPQAQPGTSPSFMGK